MNLFSLTSRRPAGELILACDDPLVQYGPAYANCAIVQLISTCERDLLTVILDRAVLLDLIRLVDHKRDEMLKKAEEILGAAECNGLDHEGKLND